MLEIIQADSETHYRHVRELIAEYVSWDITHTRQLGFDVQALLEFQYDQGGGEIPGEYAPPDGCLLLAFYASEIAGCGALRKLSERECEVKRLYVRDVFRGKHVGRSLVSRLIETARQAGYATIRLETTTFMKSALRLYQSFGFKTCEPYYAIPENFREITVFMKLELQSVKAPAAETRRY
jgi:GNAT superfamily N-acetyltransferase